MFSSEYATIRKTHTDSNEANFLQSTSQKEYDYGKTFALYESVLIAV